jgi:hypothetical protein
MVVVTGAVGEEIVIDGRIRIRILAIHGDEVYLEMNLPEGLRSDDDGGDEQGQSSCWSVDSGR